MLMKLKNKYQSMKRILSLVVFLLSLLTTFGQTVLLTFTGRDANDNYVQLDSVSICNITQGWQETIFWADTILTLQVGTGIKDYDELDVFALRQNNPNPFNGITYASLQTTCVGDAVLELTDVSGRIVEMQNFASLQPGNHQFRVNVASAGIYFLSARSNGHTSSIKMVNNGQGSMNRIEYQNFVNVRNVETQDFASQQKNNAKGVSAQPFFVGDQMEYVGYATIYGIEVESEHIVQTQSASQTFSLQFEIPHVLLPTVTTLALSDIYATTASCGGNVTSDGGATITARGLCWSTNPNPTIADSHTTDGAGIGHFVGNMTGLIPNTTYYVCAYATNGVGTSYGNQSIFTTAVNPDGNPCPDAITITDVDNNTYNTVRIGNQCWMKENLRTMHYADGTSISLGNGSVSSTTAYCYYPGNSSSNVATYGYLYNWKAVMRNSSSSNAVPSGVQGICPTGWHVPSNQEWTQLLDYVRSQSLYQCNGSASNIAKAISSTTSWGDSCDDVCAVGNNLSANNATGFSAVPAGTTINTGSTSFRYAVFFWSATQEDSDCSFSCQYYYYDANVYNNNCKSKTRGLSVRCLKN